MWMGKIGKKSSAFINHKPFHPGNWQNQEKVWLAEQKHKEEQKKQQELAERRAEEFKIEELRRALRGESDAAAAILKQKQQQQEEENAADSLRRKAREAEVQQKRMLQQQAALLRRQQPAKSSMYAEDVYTNGHTSVFGSFFCRESKQWGYKCCGSLQRSAICNAVHPGCGRNKKRKLRSGDSGTRNDPLCETEGATGERDSESVPPVPGPPSSSEDKRNRDDSSKEKPMYGDATVGTAFTSRPLPPRKGRVREAGVAAYLKLLEEPADASDL